MPKTPSILLALAISLVPSPSDARVVRFVVEQKRPLAEGTSFGSAGAYERLDGTAFFEVDPKDPLNAIVVNIDRAPRNARGMVEFSAPFSILKPTDPAKGNHKIFFGITNRGNKQAISYFNFGSGGAGGNNPLTAADLGDGFLMRLGYTVVETAWEGDLVPGGGRLVPKFPVAKQPDGSPIVAKVRIEYSDRTIPDKEHSPFRWRAPRTSRPILPRMRQRRARRSRSATASAARRRLYLPIGGRSESARPVRTAWFPTTPTSACSTACARIGSTS